MDAISPEFQFEGSIDDPNAYGFRDWRIDRENAMILHEPTRALFLIYLEHGAVPEQTSISQLRAKLSHVCDGFPVPDDLAALGSEAIYMFAYQTACVTEFPDEIPF